MSSNGIFLLSWFLLGAKTHANPGLIAQAEKSAQGVVILT
jgi:hypothetical protein